MRSDLPFVVSPEEETPLQEQRWAVVQSFAAELAKVAMTAHQLESTVEDA